ncbi:MAG TPA: tail sheath stabilizer and completion protein [Rhabdochlamydiaceae bacterium]
MTESYLDGSMPPIYFQSIRRAAIAFGTVFNNITLIRTYPDGSEATIQKVPINFGSKMQWFEKLNSMTTMTSNQGRPVELRQVLPRLAFVLTGLTYAKDRQLNPLNQVNQRASATVTASSPLSPAPYDIGVKLVLYSKNMDDGLNILEQILPMFTPQLNVRVLMVDEMNIYQDLPIILNSVTPDDNFEEGFDKNRMLTWTLNFTIQAMIYPPITQEFLILQSIVDFKNSYFEIPTELERIEVLALGRHPPDYNKANSTTTIVDETTPPAPNIIPPS